MREGEDVDEKEGESARRGDGVSGKEGEVARMWARKSGGGSGGWEQKKQQEHIIFWMMASRDTSYHTLNKLPHSQQALPAYITGPIAGFTVLLDHTAGHLHITIATTKRLRAS